MSGTVFFNCRMLLTVWIILGYRYIRRTHSTLRQLRKLRELEDELKIQDTATLVSAYNKARDSHEHHDGLLRWIGNYIPFFEKETISECCHKAMEFAQLANINPKGPSEMRLLKDAFNTLCRKIHWEDYGEEKLIEALTYFLLSVDHTVFTGNSQSLSKIARDVMRRLGPEQTFSRETFPTLSILLLALHHVCAIAYEINPSEFDHNKQEGLYQQMNRCLLNIIDSQSYYPFYYQATLTHQSLVNIEPSSVVSSKERRYRLFCGVKGTAYFCQALFGAVTLNFDLDSVEKGVEEISKAFESLCIKPNSWYEYVQPLTKSRGLVQSYPEKLKLFEDCFEKVEEILNETLIKDDQIALRFAMIQEVTLLALDSQDDSVRGWATSQLSYFGKCCAPDKGWAQDPIIIEALVKAVLELRQKLKSQLDVDGLLTTIGFHVGGEKLTEMVTIWKQEVQRREEDEERSNSTHRSGCESLFIKIKKEMSLDDSVSTRSDTQDMLKKHNKKHSKVPSLFENEPSRHANNLEHSLVLHEKVFASNGQVQVVKQPIPLEDLFKNRQLNPGTLLDKVKRVLLFGNPGTGKTTIAKKIAYKWSVDEWGNAFDMLYLVPVRELSSNKYDDSASRKQRNLETAITDICFHDESDEIYEALRSQVQEDLDRESTLIVFDGLDEGEEMIRGIIESTESKQCRVMVLSRPQNLHHERNLADVEVECMGLDDEQLVKFIQMECSSIELVDHLQRHPAVWDISHIPVVAHILVFLYKIQKKDIISEDSSLNMCSLYSTMSRDIWDRYVKKTKIQCRRDHIFGALEELAFCALEDGQILINQHLVRNVCRDQQTSDVLRDSGFLLLKRECVHYQFPHLSFQEFFAGQYMAHSMMSRDEGRKEKAVKFLKENKYCANFKQVFCFMMQALTLENHEEGYQEVESIINDGPTALGYQQHLLLNMELLGASLSASRSEDREGILDYAKILDRAFAWIDSRECYNDALEATLLASANNPDMDRFYGTSISDTTKEFANLFIQIARAARYIPNQWEKVISTLKTDLAVKRGTKGVSCIVPLMKAIPEERHNLLKLYWEYVNHHDSTTIIAALSYLPDIVTLTPSYAEELFEKFKTMFFANIGNAEEFGFLLDIPKLAQIMPDRWQDIMEIFHKGCIDNDAFEDFELHQIGRFVELLPERVNYVVDLIRESPFSDDQSKKNVARSSLSLIKAMPENSQEIVEILWTLCEDGDQDVYNATSARVIHLMLSWGEKTDSAVDTLLNLSDSRPQSACSSLVQLIAVAYKLVEETAEGVDRLLSSLSQDDLETLLKQVGLCMLDLIGTKTEKEMGLHWLHLMIVKTLVPSEIDEEELRMIMDNVDTDPNKVAVMSAKLMCSPQFPGHHFVAPVALSKLAICCPEYEEDLINSIDGLTQHEDRASARIAYIHMVSLLERLPQRAERVINSLQESLHLLSCFEFLQMREFVSLDSLLKAYMISSNDLLIFFIVWKSFDMPVTMETRGNGKTELIVQTTSNSKKRYKFQTAEQAQAFVSSFDECIEVVFPDVASLVPRLDSQERARPKNPLFENLRERLTTSSL